MRKRKGAVELSLDEYRALLRQDLCTFVQRCFGSSIHTPSSS